MIKPSLQEARKLASGNSITPISIELFLDIKTPIEILKSIKSSGKKTYILESVENSENWGRYTFLGYDPLMSVYGKDGVVTIDNGSKKEIIKENPQKVLKEIAARYKSPRIDSMPSFTGGFVGYFAYDYMKYIEPSLECKGADTLKFNDFELMLFDKVVAIDHFRQKIILIINIKNDNLEENYINGVTALKDMERLILSDKSKENYSGTLLSDFNSQFSKEEYCNIVKTVKNHIYEGDIFQCVPSNRFEAEYEGDLLPAYRLLRTTNPSSYMFYMQFEDMQLAGASPETLISLKNGVITTYPLAGTCKRTSNEKDTQNAIKELLENKKELSEHDMLVDLGRNDLGKVCRFGSVQVEDYRQIKRCSHVCHISSKVTGVIKEEYDAFDAIAAVIPAGTLSGAPKKRAMEIIDTLEKERRGVYGGAVGYIDFTGNMDLCIGIRMATLKNNRVYVQAGAGIVSDSIPENEYNECLSKAKAMKEVLTSLKEVQ